MLAGCTQPGIDRAERLHELATDGEDLYYVRDDSIVRGDGHVIADGVEHVRSLVVDGPYLYALTARGQLDRYSRDGGVREQLLAADAQWHGDLRFAHDRTHAYVLAIDTTGDLLLPTSTVTYRNVSKATGEVIVGDLAERLFIDVTGDGNTAYGYLRRSGDRWTDEIVQLTAGAPIPLMPMPRDSFDLKAVAGSLFVRAFDGLRRVEGSGLTRVLDDVPSRIIAEAGELYVHVNRDDRDDGCEVLAVGSARCVHAGAASEIAIVRGELYITYNDSGETVLDRVPL